MGELGLWMTGRNAFETEGGKEDMGGEEERKVKREVRALLCLFVKQKTDPNILAPSLTLYWFDWFLIDSPVAPPTSGQGTCSMDLSDQLAIPLSLFTLPPFKENKGKK